MQKDIKMLSWGSVTKWNVVSWAFVCLFVLMSAIQIKLDFFLHHGASCGFLICDTVLQAIQSFIHEHYLFSLRRTCWYTQSIIPPQKSHVLSCFPGVQAVLSTVKWQTLVQLTLHLFIFCFSVLTKVHTYPLLIAIQYSIPRGGISYVGV